MLRFHVCHIRKDPQIIGGCDSQGVKPYLPSRAVSAEFTLSPWDSVQDPAWPHTDVCENDTDLLSIILDATFGHLPEAMQLMQNCNKKKKRMEKTRKTKWKGGKEKRGEERKIKGKKRRKEKCFLFGDTSNCRAGKLLRFLTVVSCISTNLRHDIFIIFFEVLSY